MKAAIGKIQRDICFAASPVCGVVRPLVACKERGYKGQPEAGTVSHPRRPAVQHALARPD